MMCGKIEGTSALHIFLKKQMRFYGCHNTCGMMSSIIYLIVIGHRADQQTSDHRWYDKYPFSI